MKSFIVSLVLVLGAATANAQREELVPVMEAGLFVAFQYDSVIPAPGFENPFSWTLNITPTVSPSTFFSMKWNLLNVKTGKLLFPSWQLLPQDNPRSLHLVLAQDRALYDFFPAHKNYEVVISPNEKDVAYFVSMQNVCVNHPAQAQDLTNVNNRSCMVARSVLPDVDKECTDYRKEILDYGMECKVAKQLFEEAKICGVWTCP